MRVPQADAAIRSLTPRQRADGVGDLVLRVRRQLDARSQRQTRLVECDERQHFARHLLAAVVRIDTQVLVRALDHGEHRCAEVQLHARARRIDIGRKRKLDRSGIAQHPRRSRSPGVVRGAHRQRLFDGVGVAAARHAEPEGRHVLGRVAEGEADLAPPAGGQRHRARGISVEHDATGDGPDAHGGRAAGALVHHDARGEFVVAPQEPGQRRPGEQRARDEQRRSPAAVAIARGDCHGHYAKRRQVVRELCGCHRAPLGIGHHGADEECGGLEPRAQHFPGAQAATAAG